MFRRLVSVAVCAIAFTLAPAEAAKEHVQAKIRRGEIASRAVNVGGWLLSEYWMAYTSPLYTDVPKDTALKGEYAIMKLLGKEKGEAAFEKHWSSFIVEDDIKQIAKSGLNTVRVTTGYWIVNDEDDSQSSEVSKTYARGSLKYLDQLINKWAVKYNVAVMVSLHAHEGSQNGLDHSAPVQMMKTGWGQDPQSVKSSLLYAEFIAKRYKDSPAFLGLNLMNEPTNPVSYDVLEKYYTDAYTAIRATGNDCIIGTSPWLAHQARGFMEDFMPCPEYYNVWHEFHVYYKWGFDNVPKDSVFRTAGAYASSHIDGWKGNPIFLGEFSLATSDQLNLTDEELTKFYQIQLVQGEAAPSGWAFWAWRHDDETIKTSGWSLRQLIKKDIVKIPTNIPHRNRTEGSKCWSKDTIKVALDQLYTGEASVGDVDAEEIPSGDGSKFGESVSNFKTKDASTSPPPAPSPSPSSATTAVVSTIVLGVSTTVLTLLW